jgi:hypothetical protein
MQYRILKCFELLLNEVDRSRVNTLPQSLVPLSWKWWMRQVTRYREERQIWNRARETRAPLSEEGARKEEEKEGSKASQTYSLHRSTGQGELFKKCRYHKFVELSKYKTNIRFLCVYSEGVPQMKSSCHAYRIEFRCNLFYYSHYYVLYPSTDINMP